MIAVIDFCEFSFEKDGDKIKYRQLVLRTEGGFVVKKLAPALYIELLENEQYYLDTPFTSLLYDEYGRVAGIKK